jgi:osmotically-inducible protein OsmY
MPILSGGTPAPGRGGHQEPAADLVGTNKGGGQERMGDARGFVEWQYQKNAAETAVRRIKGVRGVINNIVPKPQVEPADIKRQIENALKRLAEVDSNRITVEAIGSEVILKGTVRSWAEREEAERAAWSAPGVIKVEDRIVVSP